MRVYSERSQDSASKQLLSSRTTPEAMGLGWVGLRRGSKAGASLGMKQNIPHPPGRPGSLPLWALTLAVTTTSKTQEREVGGKTSEGPLRRAQVSGGRKSFLILLQRREGENEKEKETGGVESRGEAGRSREKGTGQRKERERPGHSSQFLGKAAENNSDISGRRSPRAAKTLLGGLSP